MKHIGLILLGFAVLPGLSACNNAEAAPSAMAAPAALNTGSSRFAATHLRPPNRSHRRPVVHACQRPTHVSATSNGRYTGQLARLYVPQDCQSYGSFQDYGAYPSTSYAGQRRIPAGFWVYHYPYWHVYSRRTTAAVTPQSSGAYCSAPASTSANANGKYRVLVRRLYVPTDCGTYGAFKDYGYYGATSYAGHSGLPGGYWVYRYPHWYLWRAVKP